MISKQTIWNVAEHSWKQNKATAVLWLTHCLLKNTIKTTSNVIKTFLFMLISAGSGTITDAEIKALSEILYALDSNKASASELIVESQALVPDSETGSQSDLSPRLWGSFLSSRFVFNFIFNPASIFMPPACFDTWTRRFCSPDPPMLLCWHCWTTTTGWLDRQRTSAPSSWQNRTPFSKRQCPTLSWAESCLRSSTPKVNVTHVGPHAQRPEN